MLSNIMKLHCILISFAFVNVLSIMTVEYVKSVFITNKYIEMAFTTDAAGLKTVIKNIVNGDFTMEEIALMLAIPESAFILNKPELICIAEQEAVQRKIILFTNSHLLRLSSNEDIEIDSLSHLGVNRRRITGQVTKTLLSAALSGEEPIFQNFTEMCRLIGLYRSIKFPDLFVRIADVANGICNLTSRDGRVYKYKRTYGIIFMEVQVDPINKIVVLLSEQIRRWNIG